jgi:nucleoside-diphosphate-sugar epimerase
MQRTGKVLVVGASGIIGRALLAGLGSMPSCGPHCRVVLLEHCRDAAHYEIAREGYVDLTSHRSLAPWLSIDLDAVIFLAGVGSDAARRKPKLSLAIHLHSFVELLNWAGRLTAPPRVIYASSTAARLVDSTSNTYGAQKLAAEVALNDSGVPGIALRFPTIMPRSNDPTSLTLFLNAAFTTIAAKEPYVWPIHIDREIRLMSHRAAAKHIRSALGLPRPSKPFTLELPATVATPRNICDALDSPSHCRIASIIPDIEATLASRPVNVACKYALDLGFDAAEPLDVLVDNFIRSV